MDGLAYGVVSAFRATEVSKSGWMRMRKGRMFVPELGQMVAYVRRGHVEHLKGHVRCPWDSEASPGPAVEKRVVTALRYFSGGDVLWPYCCVRL
eukprot:CAMPEP_0206243962 /NCGR_PEP_ID=MMETSP0047_2-20121206/17890_1 /ASSEMBLY_ACC=CAM_ASM_000192 /TAXON_ID=195065 /ORGANISM="Chroomonas mesostigmatica_cf, Strain CCMP1168" /LENGTH=93 /DNA_ID=CAMNT_0053669123 /DNA_START=39 /DNA_END=317 /DNA_ORIENTATION=-